MEPLVVAVLILLNQLVTVCFAGWMARRALQQCADTTDRFGNDVRNLQLEFLAHLRAVDRTGGQPTEVVKEQIALAKGEQEIKKAREEAVRNAIRDGKLRTPINPNAD